MELGKEEQSSHSPWRKISSCFSPFGLVRASSGVIPGGAMGQGEPSPADVEKDDGEDERDGSEETGEEDGEDDQVGSPTVKAACPSAGSPRGLGILHLAEGPRMTAMAAAAAAAAALIERENSAQGSGSPSATSQSQLDGFARGFQQVRCLPQRRPPERVAACWLRLGGRAPPSVRRPRATWRLCARRWR